MPRRHSAQVIVTEVSPRRDVATAATDAEGRWQARSVPAGQFTVRAMKGGYATGSFGQTRPSLPPATIALAVGQAIDRVDISLPRGGVITGRVLDERGQPMTGALVRLLASRYIDGVRQLADASGSWDVTSLLNGGITNDLGEYRLHSLPAGDYFVSAAAIGPFPDAAARTAYVTTFYPGVHMAGQAQRIALGQGQQAAGVDFPLVRTTAVTVSGTVQDAAGQPVPGGFLTLRPVGGGVANSDASVQVAPGGSFTFTFVPPGNYVLTGSRLSGAGGGGRGGSGVVGSAGPPGGSFAVAPTPIFVAGTPVANIQLLAARGASVLGRLVFDVTGPATALNNYMVTAQPLEPGVSGLAQSRPNNAGEFVLTGLTGRQVIRVRALGGELPLGVAMKAVRLNGIDMADTGIDAAGRDEVRGIEVEMTTRASVIGGAVQDARNQPTADYVVVAFSSTSDRWAYQTRYVQTAQPDRDGRFSLRGLPPDEYCLVAVPFIDAGDEFDPQRLDAWRRDATRVRLAESEARTVTLRLGQ